MNPQAVAGLPVFRTGDVPFVNASTVAWHGSDISVSLARKSRYQDSNPDKLLTRQPYGRCTISAYRELQYRQPCTNARVAPHSTTKKITQGFYRLLDCCILCVDHEDR